jgi:hypothetical protein
MPRYFFDTRDDGDLVRDDQGFELEDLAAVKALAAKTLAEMAADVLPSSDERCLGIDVRNEHARPCSAPNLPFGLSLPDRRQHPQPVGRSATLRPSATSARQLRAASPSRRCI